MLTLHKRGNYSSHNYRKALLMGWLDNAIRRRMPVTLGVEITSSKMDESSERKAPAPPMAPAAAPRAAGTEVTLPPAPPL
jgi:hypothetical protein